MVIFEAFLYKDFFNRAPRNRVYCTHQPPKRYFLILRLRICSGKNNRFQSQPVYLFFVYFFSLMHVVSHHNICTNVSPSKTWKLKKKQTC